MYVFSLAGGGLCHRLSAADSYYAQMPPSTLARLKLARLSQVEQRGGRNQHSRATARRGELKMNTLVLSSAPRKSIKQHTQYFTPPRYPSMNMCRCCTPFNDVTARWRENGPWSRYASVIMRLREYSRKRRRYFNQDIKQTLRERLYAVEQMIFN